MEWVIVSGSTVEAATDRALKALSIALEDADVEVLAAPSRSRWGLRRHPARVRVRVRPTGPPPRLGESRRDRRRPRRHSGANRQSAKRAPSQRQGQNSGSQSGRRRSRRRRGSGAQSGKASVQRQPSTASTKAPTATSGAAKTTDKGPRAPEGGQGVTASRRRRIPGHGDED